MAGLDFDSLTDGLRTVFLAGVGAVAQGAEKGKEVVDELVRKGEFTVDQGKALNTELSRKAAEGAKSAFTSAKNVASDVEENALKARMSVMTDEERATFVDRVTKLNEEVAAKKAKDAGDAAKSTESAEEAVNSAEDEASTESKSESDPAE